MPHPDDLSLEALAASVSRPRTHSGIATLDAILRNQAILANALVAIQVRLGMHGLPPPTPKFAHGIPLHLTAVPKQPEKPALNWAGVSKPVVVTVPRAPRVQNRPEYNPRQCPGCGKAFRPRSIGHGRYTKSCSRKCAAELQRRNRA